MNNRAQQRFDRSLKQPSLIDTLGLTSSGPEAVKRRARAEKVLPAAEAALASGLFKGRPMTKEQIADLKHIIKMARKAL